MTLNRYWRWLGNCWDRTARLDAEIRRLREDIEAKEHLIVEREARIAELEASPMRVLNVVAPAESTARIAKLERDLARLNGINSALSARLTKLGTDIRGAVEEALEP